MSKQVQALPTGSRNNSNDEEKKMRFNATTIFPLTLVLLGILIIFGSGDEPISSKFLLQLGMFQVPVGLILVGLGLLLYRRANAK